MMLLVGLTFFNDQLFSSTLCPFLDSLLLKVFNGDMAAQWPKNYNSAISWCNKNICICEIELFA